MSKNREKPVVGQVVYSLNIGNAARRREQTLIPLIVTKVGRKYFTVAREYENGQVHERGQFHLSDWGQKTDYAPDERLFASEQEWLDVKAARELEAYIKKAFDWASPRQPLDKLREIKLILDR